MSKDKKVTFSEEIDSSITGFSLGITFILIALFVYYIELFHNRIIEILVAIILVFIGMVGTFLEIGKAKNDDIKGIDDLGLGVTFSIIAIFLVLKYDKLFLNIICFLVLLFSLFATIQGVLKICYSLKIQKRNTMNKKIGIAKIIVGITEIAALAVAIIQLITELIHIL